MSISLMEDIRRSQKDPIGINIYYNKNLNIDGKIKNILCGIEEEEIPFILIPDLEDDAKVLGDRAAKSSKLGVGIGISQTEVTLYHEKLDINKPLFKCKLNNLDFNLRVMGVNGARLIKGNPFIIIEEGGE
nr:glycerol dehydratase reactivase beta/small subunit family protein [uncultured Fusobacterium sp.]